MNNELKQQKLIRKKTYIKKYGYAESTAQKKAASDEILIRDLQTMIIVIAYHMGRQWHRVTATLIDHEYLHRQNPQEAFIKVFDTQEKKIAPIPDNVWIHRVK